MAGGGKQPTKQARSAAVPAPTKKAEKDSKPKKDKK